MWGSGFYRRLGLHCSAKPLSDRTLLLPEDELSICSDFTMVCLEGALMPEPAAGFGYGERLGESLGLEHAVVQRQDVR